MWAEMFLWRKCYYIMVQICVSNIYIYIYTYTLTFLFFVFAFVNWLLMLTLSLLYFPKRFVEREFAVMTISEQDSMVTSWILFISPFLLYIFELM
ncbi:hypothetical protein J3E69DRAFT_290930 [Trichoderma sp. SZMC 28015]